MFGFAKEKELEAAYQHQVDDMFFYDYQCCTKKHGITDDIHNIPSNEDDEVELDYGVRQGYDLGIGEKYATIDRED